MPDKQTNKHTNKQANKQTDKQTNRKARARATLGRTRMANNLYTNTNIPQSNNRYSNLRTTNPNVTDMSTYRSRRSYFTSPEYKVKSQRQQREQ